MRHPIRIKRARAARTIDYSLEWPVAWNGRFSCARAAIGALLLAIGLCGCGDGGSGGRGDGAGRSGDVLAEAAPTESSRGAAAAATTRAPSQQAETPVIVFLGTSLTAGYGLEEDQAFPALIQERIDSAALDYRVINAGVSGDTSAGGLRRLDWLLRLPISMLVLELGANDMLRGQSVDQLRQNLEAILERTREAHPNARLVIAGMRAAPNLGRDYGDAFDATYPALADEFDAPLVPFLLEDVAARRNLNQADGIHPTAEGHALIAERVWRTLEPILRNQAQRRAANG